MRRTIYAMERADALALFARAPAVQVATVDPEGRPHLRTVHGVVVGDAICFHGSPKGERASMIGWPAVVSVEEIVGGAPSYFFDPERACPATTYYVSAQARGVIEAVDEPARKAEVLQALMERFQPEGGHAPITAGDPAYVGPIAGIQIQRVPLTDVVGKSKLAQNRRPAELTALVQRLWERGDPGDPAAIERLLAANPGASRPEFLRAPAGANLLTHLDPTHLGAMVRLVGDAYWNLEIDPQRLRRAHLGSSAWVGARAPDGRLVATARAVSDGAKHAWIYDVGVDPEWRGRGVGKALLRLLLDHPRVRGAAMVHLRTRDAHDFYRPFGFEEVDPSQARPQMTLRRP